MQKDKILQSAISKKLSMTDIGDNCKSAFSIIHQCISTIDTYGVTEAEKRKLLINNLQKFWHGGGKFVAGCKREHVQKIIKLVFGIGSDRTCTLNREIEPFTFYELYLYYCYIERIAKGDIFFSKLLWENNRIKQERRNIQRREEREERLRKQEEEKNKKIEGMGREERWKYEIFEGQQDMKYFQKLDDTELSTEDKIIISGLLRDYWKGQGKWEGHKVSKKQILKIAKVKEILLEKE